MPGKVTVFNCFNEPITGLSVSGNGVGNVTGWSTGGTGSPPQYTPSSITVPRSKYAAAGTFAIGANPIIVPWDSFTGRASITIPSSVPGSGPISLDQDLMLYITANEAFLTTQFGYVVGDPFPISGSLSSQSPDQGGTLAGA
jgi:hypothetical protein